MLWGGGGGGFGGGGEENNLKLHTLALLLFNLRLICEVFGV